MYPPTSVGGEMSEPESLDTNESVSKWIERRWSNRLIVMLDAVLQS